MRCVHRFKDIRWRIIIATDVQLTGHVIVLRKSCEAATFVLRSKSGCRCLRFGMFSAESPVTVPDKPPLLALDAHHLRFVACDLLQQIVSE